MLALGYILRATVMDSPTALTAVAAELGALAKEKLLNIPDYAERQELHAELNTVAYELLRRRSSYRIWFCCRSAIMSIRNGNW